MKTLRTKNEIEQSKKYPGMNLNSRACVDWFPKGTFKYQKYPGFYLHENLKRQIDYYIKNVDKDWDFTIIISGGGGVRVGKSLLALQLAAYWTYELNKRIQAGIIKNAKKIPFNIKNNIVFDGAKLIEKGNYLGQNHKYSTLIFDEAGADLEGTKAMLATTRAVKDYLRECGQYNMLTILVLPEFFDLPKGVAISRSNCLIDVYYLTDEEGNFKRGYFKFYSKPAKKYLYLQGKKNLDYRAGDFDFYGDFEKFYPISEEDYRKQKMEALKKRESTTFDKKLFQRNIAWYLLIEEFGMTQLELARRTTAMGSYLIQTTIAEALKGLRLSGKLNNQQQDDRSDKDDIKTNNTQD